MVQPEEKKSPPREPTRELIETIKKAQEELEKLQNQFIIEDMMRDLKGVFGTCDLKEIFESVGKSDLNEVFDYTKEKDARVKITIKGKRKKHGFPSLRKIFCKIGIHTWSIRGYFWDHEGKKYVKRRCEICGKKQIK
jgi:hypothetical protein